MGLLLLGSVIFGLLVITRFLTNLSRKTAGEWKVLHEEPNI